MRCQGNEAMRKNVPTSLVLNAWVLHEKEKPIAFETTGMVDSNTERLETYLAEKGLLLRFSVSELALLFGRLKLIPWRTTRTRSFVRHWLNLSSTLHS